MAAGAAGSGRRASVPDGSVGGGRGATGARNFTKASAGRERVVVEFRFRGRDRTPARNGVPATVPSYGFSELVTPISLK